MNFSPDASLTPALPAKAGQTGLKMIWLLTSQLHHFLSQVKLTKFNIENIMVTNMFKY